MKTIEGDDPKPQLQQMEQVAPTPTITLNCLTEEKVQSLIDQFNWDRKEEPLDLNLSECEVLDLLAYDDGKRGVLRWGWMTRFLSVAWVPFEASSVPVLQNTVTKLERTTFLELVSDEQIRTATRKATVSVIEGSWGYEPGPSYDVRHEVLDANVCPAFGDNEVLCSWVEYHSWSLPNFQVPDAINSLVKRIRPLVMDIARNHLKDPANLAAFFQTKGGIIVSEVRSVIETVEIHDLKTGKVFTVEEKKSRFLNWILKGLKAGQVVLSSEFQKTWAEARAKDKRSDEMYEQATDKSSDGEWFQVWKEGEALLDEVKTPSHFVTRFLGRRWQETADASNEQEANEAIQTWLEFGKKLEMLVRVNRAE
ncbi:hypothetical protein HZA38_02810 [Candidatus Peregrinibacteria bacterium]|nr:hypothetical protein [Candidatus Peregrinibacteria bacterium]